jgi:hypothetical protein
MTIELAELFLSGQGWLWWNCCQEGRLRMRFIEISYWNAGFCLYFAESLSPAVRHSLLYWRQKRWVEAGKVELKYTKFEVVSMPVRGASWQNMLTPILGYGESGPTRGGRPSSGFCPRSNTMRPWRAEIVMESPIWLKRPTVAGCSCPSRGHYVRWSIFP